MEVQPFTVFELAHRLYSPLMQPIVFALPIVQAMELLLTKRRGDVCLSVQRNHTSMRTRQHIPVSLYAHQAQIVMAQIKHKAV
jgi:hypothetical protein